jgi:hypothetical protein
MCSCGPINPSRCSFLREKVTNRIHSSTLNFFAVDVEQFTGVRAGDMPYLRLIKIASSAAGSQ